MYRDIDPDHEDDEMPVVLFKWQTWMMMYGKRLERA